MMTALPWSRPSLRGALVVTVLSISCWRLNAEPLVEGPLLRMEAGMHVNFTRHISATGDGRLALTASEDKTAKLWELPSGRLLRTFRPPIGEGAEGMLYSCALSPDGSTAAVAGYTRGQQREKHCIYIFDTSNGHIKTVVPDLPSISNDLAFSKDGLYLACVFGEGFGLRLWKTINYSEFASDAGYGGSSESVDWDNQNRLVTTCADGQIRFYNTEDGRLSVVARRTFEAANGPVTGRFSPDGSRVAVGFSGLDTVSVLRASDLLPVSTFRNTGKENRVTWSADGKSLVAAGRGALPTNFAWPSSEPTYEALIALAPKLPPLVYGTRTWPRDDPQSFKDSGLAPSNLTDLRPLPDNSILYSSGTSWGIKFQDDRSVVMGASPIANFSLSSNRFKLSQDGMTVAFCYRPVGERETLFSVRTKRLYRLHSTDKPSSTSPTRDKRSKAEPGQFLTRMTAARTNSNRVEWNPEGELKLLGRVVPQQPYERFQSVAVARNSSYFVAGSDFRLACVSTPDHGIENRWEIKSPGIVHALNTAADDRLVVAGFSDGTIRWYKASDGKELLAFFPHADRTHWVLWTPSGYYDASPGSEDIIGWQLNRGGNKAAELIPSSRFRAIYYRPDVVQRVLETLDEEEAVRRSNAVRHKGVPKPRDISEMIYQLAPPVVELVTGGLFGTVTIPSDAANVAVRYKLWHIGREAHTRILVRFNGRPVDADASAPPDDREAAVNVPIPKGAEGEISIVAAHEMGTSEAAVLRIRREGGVGQTRKPDLYLISCGIDHYRANGVQNPLARGTKPLQEAPGKAGSRSPMSVFPNLQCAVADADEFAALFAGQEGRTYRHVYPIPLADERATTAEIVRALNEVKAKSQPNDVVVFFFAGHGDFVPDPGFMLLTYDTDWGNLAGTALSGTALSQLLAGIRGSVVVLLDACHSGAVLAGERTVNAATGPGDLSGLINQLSSTEQGIIVISSSDENESSLEDRAAKHGIFTRSVMEGFAGSAAQDGRITCASLQKWVAKRVPELAKEMDLNSTQTPVCIMPKGVPDLVLSDH